MYQPITIANYFIKKYGLSDNLTPLKLIKLVYISYGWYLALTKGGKKLVDEQPQAWGLGPVFPSLYKTFRRFGKSAIKTPCEQNNADILTDDDVKFLDKIWSIYGDKDGLYLSAITHKPETPWSEIYPKGYNLEIPDNIILAHYNSKLKKPA